MINWPGAFYFDNNPSLINEREVNGLRYYFTTNLRESMGQSVIFNKLYCEFYCSLRLPTVFSLELFYDDCRQLVTFASSLDSYQVTVLCV